MSKEVGIENLSEAISKIGEFVSTVDDVLEDKKVNLREGFQLGLQAPSLIKILIKWNEMKSEFNDLNEIERNELSRIFREKFNLRNDMTEEVIESIVDWLLDFDNLRDLFKKAAA